MIVIKYNLGPNGMVSDMYFTKIISWNGYDCREVTSSGAQKCGIEKTKNKMVGRGVLLDVPREMGVARLEDGYGITCEDG